MDELTAKLRRIDRRTKALNRLVDERRKEINAEIEDAYVRLEATLEQLAPVSGMSHETVKKLLASRGVPIRSRGRRPKADQAETPADA